MNLQGTIQRRGVEFFLQTTGGDYKIHFSERERLNLSDEACGLTASAEDAPEIQPPASFPEWKSCHWLMRH
jgi:hypothetical protein